MGPDADAVDADAEQRGDEGVPRLVHKARVPCSRPMHSILR